MPPRPGERVNTAQHALARIAAEPNVLGCHGLVPLLNSMMRLD
jgi:hypothetical protein